MLVNIREEYMGYCRYYLLDMLPQDGRAYDKANLGKQVIEPAPLEGLGEDIC